MREAVHALKYQQLHPAARRLGRMLAEAIAQLLPEAPAEMLVVPVPLYRRKHRERGFNQTQLLAAAAIKALRQSNPEWRLTLSSGILMRHRATSSQAGLTPRQRRLNVRNAFRVTNHGVVAGRHILVVDDILTTGATVRSVSQASIAAGAESVWVATLARAGRIHAIGSSAAELPGKSASSGGVVATGNVPDAQQLASMYQRSF
jgi:ComF family protein